MEPTYLKSYTLEEAIASFGSNAAPQFFVQKVFFVLPTVVACLATIGEPASESFLPSPSALEWKRTDHHTAIPGPVTDVYGQKGRTRAKLKAHHIFLRLPADRTFVYAGEAHLGSYGGHPGRHCANFSLNQKLPREVWLRFGGYPGWLIDLNHETHRVGSRDLPAFRALTSELPRREFSHLTLTRYEEDSLTIHTNAQRGWLIYLREPADSGLYGCNPEELANSHEEHFRCTCGIDLSFPAWQTFPRNVAIAAVEEFFLTGTLPPSLTWE